MFFDRNLKVILKFEAGKFNILSELLLTQHQWVITASVDVDWNPTKISSFEENIVLKHLVKYF